MKRGGPLRRTELKRKTPLRAGGGLTASTIPASPPARSTIRPVSKKRQRQHRERGRLLVEMRERQQGCCARCGIHAQLDGHELVRRSQDSTAWLNPDLVVGLCRPCHTFVTENPQAGHDEGWVVWSWEAVA